MSKFIQVNKLYNKDGKYIQSDFDSLLNTEDISEITPRGIYGNMDEVFQNRNACHVLMRNGDSFYIVGSFFNIKTKVGVN